MCNEIVRREPYTLEYVPDHRKTQGMCSQAIRNKPAVFFIVPECFKTQEMCIKVLEVDPLQLKDVPDQFKKQKMCDKAVKDDPSSLRFVPDWYVKQQQQIDVWYDDNYLYHDDEMIEWYEGYKKREAEKASIKEELLPIAWHLNRVKDWYLSEDKKGWWK